MTNLTKTRTVLHRTPGPTGHTYRPAKGDGFRDEYFVTVPPDVFADMGSPDTVTVTIEPGDRLNGETTQVPDVGRGVGNPEHDPKGNCK